MPIYNPYAPTQTYSNQITSAPMPNGAYTPGPSWNTYPYGSQSMNTQYPQYSYTPNNARNQNIIWVTGRNGAESYPMEPNTRAILMDSNDQIFYIKVVGADGRPEPLMAFKYEALNLNLQNGGSSETGASIDMSNYVTKKDFDDLKSMIEDLTKPSGK